MSPPDQVRINFFILYELNVESTFSTAIYRLLASVMQCKSDYFEGYSKNKALQNFLFAQIPSVCKILPNIRSVVLHWEYR